MTLLSYWQGGAVFTKKYFLTKTTTIQLKITDAELEKHPSQMEMKTSFYLLITAVN
jgi:hypothetical protein